MILEKEATDWVKRIGRHMVIVFKVVWCLCGQHLFLHIIILFELKEEAAELRNTVGIS